MNMNGYGSVNGRSCSYVRLGKYNNCANAEVMKVPTFSSVGGVEKGAIPTLEQGELARKAQQESKVGSVMTTFDGTDNADAVPADQTAEVELGVTEGYYDESANYVPHYNVPNYAPINTNALTHGGAAGQCGGYFDIMAAYGADAGNCVTNYIKN